MKIFLGWGRSLYDEDVSRRMLIYHGIENPSQEAIRHFARDLAKKRLQTRIVSTVGLALFFWALIEGITHL